MGILCCKCFHRLSPLELSRSAGIDASYSHAFRSATANALSRRWRKRASHPSHSLRCQSRTRFNTFSARAETALTVKMYHRSRACRVRYCLLQVSTDLVLHLSSAQYISFLCLGKRKLALSSPCIWCCCHASKNASMYSKFRCQIWKPTKHLVCR